MRTRILTDDNYEVTEEQYILQDNLRMVVVPLTLANTPDWWCSDGFSTNTSVIDSFNIDATPTDDPVTQAFALQISFQLVDEESVLDSFVSLPTEVVAPANHSSPIS